MYLNCAETESIYVERSLFERRRVWGPVLPRNRQDSVYGGISQNTFFFIALHRQDIDFTLVPCGDGRTSIASTIIYEGERSGNDHFSWFWWQPRLQNRRVTKGYKVQITLKIWCRYLLIKYRKCSFCTGTKYICSSFAPKCPHYLPKHKLLPSR